MKKASKVVPVAREGNPGRPAYELTDEQLRIVDGLAAIQCTDVEIAAVLDVSEDWMTKKKASDPSFSERLKKGKEKGKVSVRRSQFRLANTGDKTMNIWLGKQYLGQSDKHEVGGPGGGPLVNRVEVVLVDGKDGEA